VAPNASPLTKPGAQRLRAQRRRLKLSGIGSYVAAARMAELIRRYGLVWYEGISRARLDAYAGSLVVMRRSWSMGKGPAPFRSRTVATHVTELISLNGQYALRYQANCPLTLRQPIIQWWPMWQCGRHPSAATWFCTATLSPPPPPRTCTIGHRAVLTVAQSDYCTTTAQEPPGTRRACRRS
jgi:hypothetical protein